MFSASIREIVIFIMFAFISKHSSFKILHDVCQSSKCETNSIVGCTIQDCQSSTLIRVKSRHNKYLRILTGMKYVKEFDTKTLNQSNLQFTLDLSDPLLNKTDFMVSLSFHGASAVSQCAILRFTGVPQLVRLSYACYFSNDESKSWTLSVSTYSTTPVQLGVYYMTLSYDGLIAAQNLTESKKIYVLFNFFHGLSSASSSYSVYLMKLSSHNLATVVETRTTQTVNMTFSLKNPGEYYITVSPAGYLASIQSYAVVFSAPEATTTTGYIQLPHLPDINDLHGNPSITRVKLHDPESLKLVLTSVFGVLAAFAIVLSVVCLCRRRSARSRRRNGEFNSHSGDAKDCPNVLLLYSYDCPEHVAVVNALANYLSDSFNCSVTVDINELLTIQNIGIENWLYDNLYQASFIIVFSSLGARIKCSAKKVQFINDRVLPDYFSTAVEVVSAQMKAERAKNLPTDRFIVVYTKYSKISDIPLQLEMAERFKLPTDMLKLYQHMFELGSNSQKVQSRIKNSLSDYWGEELERSINRAAEFYADGGWLSRIVKMQPPPSSKYIQRSDKDKFRFKLSDNPDYAPGSKNVNHSFTINVNLNLKIPDGQNETKVVQPNLAAASRDYILHAHQSSVTDDHLSHNQSTMAVNGHQQTEIEQQNPVRPNHIELSGPAVIGHRDVREHHVADKKLLADVHHEWPLTESPPSVSSGYSDITDGQLEKDIRDIRDFPTNLNHVINVHLKISRFLDQSPTFNVKLQPADPSS